MTNMEQYKSPEKRVIDISTWSRRGNDYPLCIIGKMGDDKTMPISITVHHGFADGEHISRFFELVQEKLNKL